MASIIRIKRSSVAGNPSTLGAGELAYSNLTDNGSNGGDRLYIGMGNETAGNATNHVVIGGKYFTDMVDAATASNTPNTLVKRDASGNINVGTITGAISGNADTSSAWYTARNLSLNGDATATLLAVDGSASVSATLTLATVNANVGTYGSSTAIPIITVNAKGLVTGVSTASIATSLSISGDSGSDTVDLLSDTLSVTGGTGVTTAVTNNQVTVAIGQPVGTTDNVTFNDIQVNGTLYSNDITATSVTVDGDAVIVGNLTVQGTTTTVDSVTISVGDKNIALAKDATTSAEADGGGITLTGANATIIYTTTDDRWNLNKDLNVGTVYGNLFGNASTATTLETSRDFSVSGDATTSVGVSFDGSSNVDLAITLATVNTDIGTYGTSTLVPAITVNAKGLVTGVTTNAIPTASSATLGLASFSANNFDVTAGAVSISAIDGGTY